MAGSLIKSPGGTIVPGGGYVAGRRELVEAAAARLTAPGVGVDAGCVSGGTLRLMFQGVALLGLRQSVWRSLGEMMSAGCRGACCV